MRITNKSYDRIYARPGDAGRTPTEGEHREGGAGVRQGLSLMCAGANTAIAGCENGTFELPKQAAERRDNLVIGRSSAEREQG